MRTRDAHSNHLDMALLELALDAVEVRRVEVVAGVCLLDDVVVDGALLEGARLVGFFLVRAGHGCGRGRRKEEEGGRMESDLERVFGRETVSRRLSRLVPQLRTNVTNILPYLGATGAHCRTIGIKNKV